MLIVARLDSKTWEESPRVVGKFPTVSPRDDSRPVSLMWYVGCCWKKTNNIRKGGIRVGTDGTYVCGTSLRELSKRADGLSPFSPLADTLADVLLSIVFGYGSKK